MWSILFIVLMGKLPLARLKDFPDLVSGLVETAQVFSHSNMAPSVYYKEDQLRKEA